MEDQQVLRSLGYKLRGLLVRPDQTMGAMAPSLGEGGLVVAGLIGAAGLRGTLEIAYTFGAGRAWLAFPGAALGILLAWVGLTALLHLIARGLGGKGSYGKLLAFMGYAALPMVLTTLVSLVIYIVSPLLWPALGGAGWTRWHTVISWMGMTWGWPGLLSYYALRHGEGLSRGKARATVAAIYAVLLVGFQPEVVPGLFG